MPIVLPPSGVTPSLSRILIGTGALSDGATLSTLGATLEAGTALTNLQMIQPTDYAGFMNLSLTQIRVTFPAATTFNWIVLWHTNFTSAGTWRVQSNTGFDSGFLTAWGMQDLSTWPRPHCMLFIPATVIGAGFVDISLLDSANPDGAIRVGRLYVSMAWQPSHTYKYGISVGHIDKSEKTIVASGQTVIRRVEPAPTTSFSLQYMTKTEMLQNGYALSRLRGSALDVGICLNPMDSANEQEQLMYGTLDTPPAITNPDFNQYEQSYKFTGLL
jgi:hypothetical protein